MIVRGTSKETILEAAAQVENLATPYLRKEGRGFRFVLRPISSRGRFGRVSASGRRVHAICYHGHYAFMSELYKRKASAIIITGMTRYNNILDFARDAPAIA